ncbi:S-layer homology domain-containing protein [Paenibacillus xylanilyticus]|uniref:S-layer homology domain-containing protein n=1 Tax=Paenibacillus xylanilyticus TaxID=248903 RepID=UPI0039A31C75
MMISSMLPNITTMSAAEESVTPSVDQPETSVPTGRYEGAETPATQNAELPANTLLQMSFENNLEDQSESAISATPVRDPQFVKGRVGQALGIDSNSTDLQYVDLGKPESLQFGKEQDFSFAFWVKSPSVSGDPAILSNKNWNSGANAGYALALKGSALQWNFNTSGESRADAQIPNVVDGTWHHIAISHDRASGRVDFYKDGVPVNVTKINGTNYQGIASTMTIAGRTGTLDTGLSTVIGNDGTGNYSNALQVHIDELQMYGRTLTPQEVSNLYNSAAPLPSIENFSGSLNLIGAKHTVQGTQFRYNLDLRTPDMTTKVDKVVVEIAYDPAKFEFVSASRATKTDTSTPGIVKLELPGGNVYNIEDPLEYAKSRISELKFNTLAASGKGIIQVKHVDFYTGTTLLKVDTFESAPTVVEIHAKALEDINQDGYITVGDLALAQGFTDEALADLAAQAKYQPYKRVVVIGIDGGGVAVSKDAPYWETPSSQKEKVGDRLQIPAIRNIIEHGAISYTAKTTLPSSSSPNWGSMINGVGYEKHGLYNDDTAAYTYSEIWDYPTIFKKIREALPATKQTVFSTWSNIVQGHIEPSVGVEGHSLGDEAGAAAFAEYAASGKAQDTSLIFFQLDDMDGAGHNDGFYTKKYYEQLKKTDKNIQTIYDALKNNNLLEDTLILMLPDHGGGKENADGTLGMPTSHGQDEPLATTIFFAANGRTVATEAGKEKLLQGGNTRDLAATVLTALGLNPSIGDSNVIDGMFIPQTEQKKPEAADLQLTKLVEAGAQQVKGYDVSIKNLTSDVKAIDLNVKSGDLIFSSIEPAQSDVKMVRKETVNGMTRIILTAENGFQADDPILKLGLSPQENAGIVQITQAMIADAQGHEKMPNLTHSTREEQVSQATLIDLQVNGQTLIGFVPEQMKYVVRVPNNVSVAEVTYKVADPSLNVSIIGGEALQVGENLVEVHVQAPDASSSVYTIIIIRESEALPNQVLLSDLRVNGKSVPEFTPNTLNYKVTVPYSTSVTEVTYSVLDPTSTVTIKGGEPLEVGNNVVTITVTAQDGFQNIYTIVITRLPEAEISNNANLLDLRVNGVTVQGFSSKQYNYDLTVPYSTSVTQITYTAADPKASVTITGEGTLQVGSNLITVTVTAQDGGQQVYTIAIMRKNGTTTTPSTGGGTSAPSVAPPVEVKPEMHANALVIPDELLTSNATGNIIVQLPSDKNQVMIQTDQLKQIGDRALEVHANQVRAIVPSQIMNALRKLLPSTSETGTIVLKLEAVQTNQLSIKAPYSQIGDILAISLIITDESGKSYSLEYFPAPVNITLPIQNGANPTLAGIYRIEEEGGDPSYLGGKLNRARTSLTVDVNQSSQYVVLSFLNIYQDVPEGHWAYTTIQELSAKQIVKGQSASMFNPSGSITRAEYAALLSRALSLTANHSVSFQDVEGGLWYEEAVNAAFEAGIIQGVTENRFEPNKHITREEMAVMLVRAYAYQTGIKLDSSSLIAAADASKVSSWAAAYVQGALKGKLLSGYQEGNFYPHLPTTRAESAQSISNLLASFE